MIFAIPGSEVSQEKARFSLAGTVESSILIGFILLSIGIRRNLFKLKEEDDQGYVFIQALEAVGLQICKSSYIDNFRIKTN